MSIESPTMAVTVDEYCRRAQEAAAIFTQFTQEQTDRIVKAVYEAAFANRVSLAKQAAEETALGKWEDKVKKRRREPV
ncbi:MAG: hypothetical protein PVH19_09555, partial [Planctomycetia bacterium]